MKINMPEISTVSVDQLHTKHFYTLYNHTKLFTFYFFLFCSDLFQKMYRLCCVVFTHYMQSSTLNHCGREIQNVLFLENLGLEGDQTVPENWRKLAQMEKVLQ